ncbi:hypothetical protein SAMN05192551_101666 [Tindallia magadiensis]|uniref:Circadian input-output histidine kinase CikA n=1 Tax=Tindallia magadiensis TaxID=69895 RepID=A0A1I3B994_9FIRM|nr:PAS domain-containing hybrid sensor histidine kinase/response regulator [Tindallia magadiensis]SFH58844.1 hypothetical protein SAMN05192551_101666 [Tindallia magadiensis]
MKKLSIKQNHLWKLKKQKSIMSNNEWNHMMQEIIRHDPNAISVFDKNLIHLFVSDRFLKDYGVEEKEVIGRHHYEVFPDIPEQWRAVHQKALAGEVLTGHENKYIRKSGKIDYTNWECRPWYKKNGDIGGIVIYTEVVTEWVVVRERIRERELFLQSIIDAIQDGISVLDMDLSIIRANETIKKWYSRNTPLEGKKCYHVYCNTEAGCGNCSVVKAINSRKLEMHEVTHKMDPNDIKVIEQYAYPILDDERKVVAVVQYMRDITKQKESEERLHKINEQLILAKEAVETVTVAKSQFLANMSHELRTPINGLMGMTQLLLETELDKEQKEYLELSVKACQSLAHVVQEILEYTNLGTKKHFVEETTFISSELLEEVVELYKITAIHKGVSVTMEVDDAVPIRLKGDYYKLKQILNNLTGNAVKFTNEGSVHLSVTVKEKVNPSTLRLNWNIKDTGIGIPPDKLGDIFEQFHQVEDSHTRAYGGVGLGLSISKELSDLMGGSIKVFSQPGEGSLFIFECDMRVDD